MVPLGRNVKVAVHFARPGSPMKEGKIRSGQTNLKVESDDVQVFLDSHNQELAIDEIIEMHEKEQDIEELVSLDPVQSEDRMTVESSTEGRS
ncbi:hypothetical protein TNCV_465061 [Trichonephila clavipes]|nr:hypothetical protein TNCV_465061 [Trichonephila clavipes]